MNAAVSAAVVLASRLRDDLSVFALTLFSVQLFALFPILRHRLQVRSPKFPRDVRLNPAPRRPLPQLYKWD